MITYLKDLYIAYHLKKQSCKYAYGLRGLSKKSSLVLEPYVNIGMVDVYAEVLEVGAYSYIRSGSAVYGHCSIGRFCSLGKNITIGLEKNKHPQDWLSTSLFENGIAERYSFPSQRTNIGHDCWIGQGAIVMEGVSIGNGAIIGAGAIVTKDVPPYAIVIGVPAKVLKYRFADDLILKLESARWWDYQVDFLKDLPFDKPEDAISKLDGVSYANYKQIEISRKNLIRRDATN